MFSNYFHTYYYDRSIADGYTLKIIREDIETSYKEKLTQVMDKLEQLVQKKDVQKSTIIEHENYVKELIRYIITDLARFRMQHGDNTLGGMIICETSGQARNLAAYWDEVQNEMNKTASVSTRIRARLILHDTDDKETRKQIVTDFKKNMTVDVLIVFNMLLTGFDAPRLKRLYFGRKLKDHNLLQALTRVNRPYKDNRYGYIIDFADIKRNLEALARQLYDYWFVQFDFPDENGRPYKSSGGKMVLNESIKAYIPDGWIYRPITSLIKTGKEDANFSCKDGAFPFFTCSQQTLRCNQAAFDCSAIIIAGNGDFNVKHYTGKFNAYQRTYVLEPLKKYYAVSYFSALDKINSFRTGSNGSIIKFITKGDIENIPLVSLKIC